MKRINIQGKMIGIHILKEIAIKAWIPAITGPPTGKSGFPSWMPVTVAAYNLL